MKRKSGILIAVFISMVVVSVFGVGNTVFAESLRTRHDAWFFVNDHGLRPFTVSFEVDENLSYVQYGSTTYAKSNSHHCVIWGYPGYHNLSAGLYSAKYKLYSYPSGEYISTPLTLYPSNYTRYAMICPDDGRVYWVCGTSTIATSNPYYTTTLKAFYSSYLTVPDSFPGIAGFEDIVYVYR